MDELRQQELEDISGFWGSSRFKKRANRALADADATRIGAARKLLQEAVARMEKGLQLWLEEQLKGRGRRHTAVKWVKKVGVDTASYLTAKVLLGHVGAPSPLRSLVKSIWSHISDELRCRQFVELAPGLFNYRMDSFQTNSRVHMARSISATMSKALCGECREQELDECPHLDPQAFNLPANEKMLVGSLLIRIFMEVFPGWLEKENRHTDPTNQEAYLVATEKAQSWLEVRNELLQDLMPVALPMVVPPRKWAPGEFGGYRYQLLGKYPFVRGSKSHQREVDKANIPQVYEAVNRIQETPWRINWSIWDTLRKIEKGGGGLAGLPEFEPVPMPPRPPELDSEEFDPAILQAYKDAKADAHDQENLRKQEVRKWVNRKTIVELVEEEGAIWFPHNLDFRGRIYPIPPLLNPQGDDMSKALLEFADGKPLGEEGAWWLSVHGANCLGTTPGGQKLSHLTLEDRSEWIQTNSVRIRDTAAEPFSDLWWTDADEPWQFLAFCFAWAGMLKAPRLEEYVCYLPVSLDGTCNGLQHFAGILRDEQTAEVVNVLPSEKPNDVYQVVADAVLDRLVENPDEGHARRWLMSGLVDRNITKRPTMTFPYGSRKYGFTEQLQEHLRTKVDDWRTVKEECFMEVGKDGSPYPVQKQACAFLAKKMWEALTDKVSGAFEVMEWLQDCAREIAHSGRAVSWTVPETDFPVIQDNRRYFKSQEKRVNTHLAGGVSYRPVYYEASSEPDANRQANAISPNVVHSLDAAALMKTVTMASHDGIEHFAMVHDSYGCHPSDMGTLLEATKQSFFHLYSRHDVLQGLYQEFLNQVDDLEALPTPPSLGDLEISEVLGSDYFFA